MKLVIAAAMLAAGAPPAAAPSPAAQGQPAPSGPAEDFQSDRMNVHRNMAGCKSVLRQVQEEGKSAADRRAESRTLDREPPAHLLLAVDRHVGGCREVTFLRRNAAPGSRMPDVAPTRR
jgi:hypothetical protein